VRLADAKPGQVVRNTGNKRFYRFERPEDGRSRIRPLEHFPNGLLVPKAADTTVSPDLKVVLVGPWHDHMVILGRPEKTCEQYEAEHAELQARLAGLLQIDSAIERDARGSYSKGSHANRIRAVRERIEALERGLADVTDIPVIELSDEPFRFTAGQLVLLPSGRPARVTQVANKGKQVLCRTQAHGEQLIPTLSLSKIDSRWTATVA
jgi:hypothetical protein